MEFVNWLQHVVAVGECIPSHVVTLQLVVREDIGNFVFLMRRLIAKKGKTVVLLDDIASSAQLDASFLMSTFTGDMVFIVVDQEHERAGKIASPKRRKSELVACCMEYQGPHAIVLITSSAQETCPDWCQQIIIPEVVDARALGYITELLGTDCWETAQDVLQVLQHRKQNLSLNGACLLAAYLALLGKRIDQFCQQWLSQIFPEDYSLFTLSQYLLDRDARRFYQLWAKLAPTYPPEFWLVYWSDLMWNAYRFVSLKHAHQEEIDIRGLPFSFTKRSWRLYDPEIFAQGVERMYVLDCAHKRGGLFVPYELLFSQILHAPRA